MPGVHYVLDGRELAAGHAAADDRARYAERAAPAAGGRRRALCRRMGRRRGGRHPRAGRGRRRRRSKIDYETLPFVLDAEQAIEPGAVLVHEAHGSNVLLDKTFVWGEVDKDFAASPRKLSLRVKWGRSLDGADRDLRRGGELGPLARHARRLCLDPDAALCRPDRHRAENSGHPRCACITTSTSAAATASSAASSTPCSPATSRAGSASRCG